MKNKPTKELLTTIYLVHKKPIDLQEVTALLTAYCMDRKMNVKISSATYKDAFLNKKKLK